MVVQPSLCGTWWETPKTSLFPTEDQFSHNEKLICVFVFTYAKSQFSHNEAQIKGEPPLQNGREFVVNRAGFISLKKSDFYKLNELILLTRHVHRFWHSCHCDIHEPCPEKTNDLHMQKQRRRSASQ